MPRITGTSHRQTIFLRAFRNNPGGPEPQDWPSPSILRRWLRKPAFRAALRSVQAVLSLQTDFLITSSAANAVRSLEAPAENFAAPKRLSSLLRLAHLRQRFPVDSGFETSEFERQQTHRRWLQSRTWEELEPLIGEDAFAQLAFRRGYHTPVHLHPTFPPPVPKDTFYYNLIHDPSALLWYFKLYDEAHDRDHRFQPILLNCRHLVPDEYPHRQLPRFASPIGAPSGSP